MTTQDIGVDLKERTVLKKGLAELRANGQIPAVIHDHGRDSIHVQGDYTKLMKVYAEAGKHHPVQLKVGDKEHLALIKDADFEPVKHRLRHLVFQAIKQNEKVEAEVPVVLIGDEIPAEKKGLLVLKQLDHVQVEALPKDLPDELRVDANVLDEVGDNLTVADLQVPENVVILTDPVTQIAIVEIPKDQLAEADAIAAEQAEEKEAAKAEGEEAEEPAAEGEAETKESSTTETDEEE